MSKWVGGRGSDITISFKSHLSIFEMGIALTLVVIIIIRNIGNKCLHV